LFFRGAEPFIESSGYYCLFVSTAAKRKILDESNFPSLSLVLLGAHIGLAGSVTAAHPIIQWITDLHSLNPNCIDIAGIRKLARFFKAVKLGVLDLEKYYDQDFVSKIKPNGFPYLTYGTSQFNTSIQWVY
jgi:hypothetical protein